MDLTLAEWHKSSRSQGTSANCVEVARNLPGVIAVRDSKDPDGPKLAFSPSAWSRFITGLKNGDYDI
ncbi:DUF397 domain-containing protein [Spongiactinospora rosea]|uniref:DUF397 domain-containing protein n=1 Tax=Spongiactinospora rosea TaxID=2248750 RepID=A0A366LSR1_9ACTN|nr:DUF397 domain-containing protein [Spongiactinospora rosea]RBQ16961.1 DUF397 domain-containing protein [Spongiactinospora rosea]